MIDLYFVGFAPHVDSECSPVCVQMCHVLQYLCDCQVRHRIEALVAFSDDFVACLQENQRFRYNEVMLALNMSAALTAKKTKEFRSPPQEQVAAGLFFPPTSASVIVRLSLLVTVFAPADQHAA